MNIDFSVWYARIEKRKPFISINAPLFGDCFGVNLNFVISCVDFFFIRIKINLSSIDTHAYKRATKYRFVQHSFTTYIVFVHIYLCVLCCSRFLFVSCVKYLQPKICNETNQKTRSHTRTTNIPSRQNGKFYFSQPKLNRISPAVKSFSIEISTWEFFEIALYFSHEMFHSTFFM